ncbi:uncharacterized protein LOC121739847 [Aricia agestis]|uniref:uncharacterized protein LOC121739847 n=1 Tax=Aricia agestis TaxID=91739 RepID=UPI001C201A20|nr:uncharacterized protein LOC121739847 [Aricia agestis]
MALKRSPGELPKDAVVITEEEAKNYVWEVIRNWESPSDIWALRHGATILGAINSVAGVLINRHYRWRFRLGSYGYMSSTIPIVVMPGILTTLLHRHLISSKIVVNDQTCPVCFEVRSMAIQAGFGTFYPLVLGATSALMLANRYSTFRVPMLHEGPKTMFKFLKHHTVRLYPTLTCMLVAQLVASAAITYFQFENTLTLRKKLYELELQLENERVNQVYS